MKCSHCNLEVPLVYQDYIFSSKWNGSKGTSVYLCYKCLSVLRWRSEIENIISKVLSCSDCNLKFLPKTKYQTRCNICWSIVFKRRKLLNGF